MAMSDRRFSVVEIEGCEYLLFSENPNYNSATASICHKGNCKNPAHFTPAPNQ